MTADTSAATGTADPSPGAATTTAADTGATGSAIATGSTGEPQQNADGQAPQTTKPDGEGNAAPETYADFVMPEGIEIDKAAVEKYTPIFKELGLTQEQAQKLVDLRAQEVKEMQDGASEAFNTAYQARREQEVAALDTQWKDAIKADPEIGGAKFDAVKASVIEAVGQVATPEMKQAFEEHRWGNHPEMVRLVYRLLSYTPPEKGERAAGAGGTKSPAAAIWGDLPQR